MPESLSRRLAAFAAGLSYDAIPEQVIDKAKTSLLHCLVMSSVGARYEDSRGIVERTLQEEGKPDGASILYDGRKATRFGAAFANSYLIQARNQADSYNMLIHPGACVIPAVLATAEIEGTAGREVLAALAAATEVECRIAGDFLPATQARGFRSSSIYGAFGAAVGSGRALGLSDDQMAGAITWANAFAAGLGEGAHALHEANGTRNGVLASVLALQGFPGSERSLDGPAGFYNAFTGNSDGRLSFTFSGQKRIELSSVADDLGERWEMLHVTPKIPPTTGYAIPVIELTRQLRFEHGFDHSQIASMQVLMNWLETSYPSPAFAEAVPGQPNRPGSTAHVAAYVAVHDDFPIAGLTPAQRDEPAVLDLMSRIEVLGVWDRVQFAPRITVRLTDGRIVEGEMQGDELEWDFATEAERLRRILDQLGWTNDRLQALVELVSNLDNAPNVAGLIALCTA